MKQGQIKTALTRLSIPPSDERHQSETRFAVVKAAEEWQRVKTMCQESSSMLFFIGVRISKFA
jgi:hypothetical protein